MEKILFNFSLPLLFSLIANLATPAIGQEAKDITALPPERGIAVITGQGGREMARYVLEMAHRSEYTIFFQSPDGATVLAVRKAANRRGKVPARNCSKPLRRTRARRNDIRRKRQRRRRQRRGRRRRGRAC